MTDDEYMAMVTRLYELRVERRLPPLWIDSGRIRVETSPGCRRRITWGQAARLAAGETVEDVFARPSPADPLQVALALGAMAAIGALPQPALPPRKPPAREEWAPWEPRRLAYLAAMGKEEW